jgi:glucokinase
MGCERVFGAVDVGGTKVAAGLVADDGRILHSVRVPMVADQDCGIALECVNRALHDVIAKGGSREIKAIGISAPGPLDPKTGVILNPPNLPCWRDFPLAASVEREFKLPVTIENDANAAGLAEAIWGAGKGCNSVFYATVGTGIGTGFVLDGKIYSGRTGAAPEGGHLPIDYRGPRCGCGKRGCIEALASGPAIANRAKSRILESRGNVGSMLQLAGGTVSAITAETVADAWRAGDPLATEVLRETAELTTIWLGAIIDLLEPEVIVVGGGVGELLSNWFPAISEMLPRWSINQRCLEIPIKLASYSADAGIAGAAALCCARAIG